MTNLEKLKAKIKELVPEIIELKFGCEVVVDGIANDNPGCENDVVVDSRIKDNQIILRYFGNVSLDNITILGRPITLEDVLYTVVNYPYKNWIWRDRATDKVLENWELLKPLSEQSEETITNLLKIFEV